MATETRAAGPIDQDANEICRDFIQQFLSGGDPPIAEYVARVPVDQRKDLAVQLVRLHIEHRARAGKPPDLEKCRELLGDQASLLLRLVGEELSPTSDGAELARHGLADFYRVLLLPLAPNQMLGRYRLVRPLGKGAFGEVWEASDPDLHRVVAIKTPRHDVDFTREDLQRFRAEAQRAAQLRHPYIVAIHDVGSEGERPFLVYELVDGHTLRDLFNFERPALVHGLRLFCQICEAFEHAHASQIVHRDIKPGNILIDIQGRPRVVDFGMAKMASADVTIIEPGAIFGTPQYMAPEQADGRYDRINTLSDIYSLGVILYEFLTGLRPFQGTSSDLLRRIREETPVPPSERAANVPAELDRICLRAMAKKQSDRYQSVAELRHSVNAFLMDYHPADSQGTTVVAPLPAQPGYAPARRTAVALGVGGAVMLSLALFWSREHVPDPKAGSELLPLKASGPAIVNGDIPVRILTEPAGAQIVVWGLDPYSNAPDPARRVEGKGNSPVSIDLAPGSYLVVAALKDGRFHEVWRTVPDRLDVTSYYMRHFDFQLTETGIAWARIIIPPAKVTDGMIKVPGSAHFALGVTPDKARYGDLLQGTESVPEFWIDSHEVTWQDMRKRLGKMPDSWTPEIGELPGDYPALVWWEDAVSHAEATGKRLVTEKEYEFAATNGGRTLLPWGDDITLGIPWTIHSVFEPGVDRTTHPPGVTGLFSNAGEWTTDAPRLLVDTSQLGKDAPLIASSPWGDPKGIFVIRGAPASISDSVALLDAERTRKATDDKDWRLRGALGRTYAMFNFARHGFRGARSARPRLNPEDL